jgi:putative ABC transport system substrate-binding protein
MGGCTSKPEGKVYKIGIAQLATHPALDAAREGFIKAMADEGFVEGVDVEYDVGNANGDMSIATTIAQKFVSEKVDLLLAIATPMAQACAAATEDIPIVFNCVTDPVAAKLVDSWEKPGGNISGVSDWADVATQVKLILEICPNVKKIGTVYNAGEPNSLVQIEELKKCAPGLGIEEVVERTVSTSADVLTATHALEGVDAIWIPTDNTVASAYDAVVKVCEEKRIPLFGADVAIVEKGAIATPGIDYYYHGEQSGKFATRVLRGKNPANMPVEKCEMTELYINSTAAGRVGVTIPQSVINRATKIIQ